MDELDKAIIKTKRYGQMFGVNYGPREIKQRLISKYVFDDITVDSRLSKQNNISLNDYGKVSKARKLAKLIGARFKDILFIGVTGSVAAKYPKKYDDIDLMIVTKKDRLWLIRLLLRIFVIVRSIPHRKYNKLEGNDEFCFNLWLEEDSLLIPKSRQNLKNAMDSILMIPLLDREDTHRKFIKENKWINKYLANAYAKSC